MIPPCRPVEIDTTTTDVVAYGGAGILVGWAWIETTGSAAAELDIYDGTGAGGALIAPISLSSGQSTRDLIPLHGLELQNGIYVAVVSGSIRGSLWIVPGTRYGALEGVTGEHPWWAGEQ